MKLYHFTFVGHLVSIMGLPHTTDDGSGIIKPEAEGIKPSGRDGMLANPYRQPPGVWLASRPSLMPTEADIAWLSFSPLSPAERERYRKRARSVIARRGSKSSFRRIANG